MPAISIRLAQLSDAEHLHALVGQLGYDLSREQLQQNLSSLLERPDHAILITEADRILGWVHVFSAPRLSSEPFAELGGLVVDAGHRGRGIGSSLVAAAVAWAEDRGMASLRVRSNTQRTDAKRFYNGLGFREKKRQAVFVRTIDGQRSTPVEDDPKAQGWHDDADHGADVER